MQENTCNRKLHYKIQQRKLLALQINAFLNTIFVDIPRFKKQQQQPGESDAKIPNKTEMDRKKKSITKKSKYYT